MPQSSNSRARGRAFRGARPVGPCVLPSRIEPLRAARRADADAARLRLRVLRNRDGEHSLGEVRSQLLVIDALGQGIAARERAIGPAEKHPFVLLRLELSLALDRQDALV